MSVYLAMSNTFKAHTVRRTQRYQNSKEPLRDYTPLSSPNENTLNCFQASATQPFKEAVGRNSKVKILLKDFVYVWSHKS